MAIPGLSVMRRALLPSPAALALSALFILGATTVAVAHDWYTDLQDSAGLSCCSERDCRPVAFCSCSDGKQCLAIDGQCVPIPWRRVLPQVPPDGRPHACWTHRADFPGATSLAIFCVILPGIS
jgi:hypothetical protein